MAFTFARCLDPALAQHRLQMQVVGALLTLGAVGRHRDESRGAVGQAVADLAWLTWNGAADDLLFIRRARLWHAGEAGPPWLWIGVELEGAAYRIACAATGPEMRPAVAAELARLGLDGTPWLGEGGGFHACAIRGSRWARGDAAAGRSFPGRIMARALPDPVALEDRAAPWLAA